MSNRAFASGLLVILSLVSLHVGCAADADEGVGAGDDAITSAPRREAPTKIATGWLSVVNKECAGARATIANDESYLLDDDMFVRAIGTEDDSTRKCNELNVAQRMISENRTSSAGTIETGTLVLAADVTRCESKVDNASTDTDAPAKEAATRGYSIQRDAANTSVRLTIDGAAECANGKLVLELRP